MGPITIPRGTPHTTSILRGRRWREGKEEGCALFLTTLLCSYAFFSVWLDIYASRGLSIHISYWLVKVRRSYEGKTRRKVALTPTTLLFLCCLFYIFVNFDLSVHVVVSLCILLIALSLAGKRKQGGRLLSVPDYFSLICLLFCMAGYIHSWAFQSMYHTRW